jgi:hypothetical protein
MQMLRKVRNKSSPLHRVGAGPTILLAHSAGVEIFRGGGGILYSTSDPRDAISLPKKELLADGSILK